MRTTLIKYLPSHFSISSQTVARSAVKIFPTSKRISFNYKLSFNQLINNNSFY